MSLVERDIPPSQLRTVNSAFNKEHLQKLTGSMRRDGWRGRALLVEEVRRYQFSQYFAWTGSHRKEAAEAAGLVTVPCRVLLAAEADAAFQAAGYEWYGYASWRDALTGFEGEGPRDHDRLRGLLKAGLEEAAEMLREELAATDGHGA